MFSSLLFWRQRRFIVCFIALMGFSVQYMMRVSFSVAIFEMMKTQNKNTNDDNKLIDVSDFEKASLLGVFFYGYITTQFSGGYLADRIGGKKVLLASVLSSSILSLFTPLCAKWSKISIYVVRVLLGASQGVIYPCVYPTLRKWAPPWERGQLCLIVFTGNYVGTTIGLLLSGIIVSKIGWQWVFYIFGIFGIIWCVTWHFYISESPVNDKRITKQELLILQEALNTLTRDYNPEIPWRKLFTSIPVWAIAAADFGNCFGYYLVLTQYSVYLNDVHFVNTEEKIHNYGIIAAIPHMIMIATSLTSGFLADFCIKKEWMSTTVCRKVFTCGAFLIQVITSVAAATATDTKAGMALIILNVSVGAIGWAGYSVNHLDICPQYGGISMGLANTFGTVPGILMTFLINYFVSNDNVVMTKYTKWRVIFLITTAFCLLGFIVYSLCASGERQAWAMNIYRHRSSIKSVKSVDDDEYENQVDDVEKAEGNLVFFLRSAGKNQNEDDYEDLEKNEENKKIGENKKDTEDEKNNEDERDKENGSGKEDIIGEKDEKDVKRVDEEAVANKEGKNIKWQEADKQDIQNNDNNEDTKNEKPKDDTKRILFK